MFVCVCGDLNLDYLVEMGWRGNLGPSSARALPNYYLGKIKRRYPIQRISNWIQVFITAYSMGRYCMWAVGITEYTDNRNELSVMDYYRKNRGECILRVLSGQIYYILLRLLRRILPITHVDGDTPNSLLSRALPVLLSRALPWSIF